MYLIILIKSGPILLFQGVPPLNPHTDLRNLARLGVTVTVAAFRAAAPERFKSGSFENIGMSSLLASLFLCALQALSSPDVRRSEVREGL